MTKKRRIINSQNGSVYLHLTWVLMEQAFLLQHSLIFELLTQRNARIDVLVEHVVWSGKFVRLDSSPINNLVLCLNQSFSHTKSSPSNEHLTSSLKSISQPSHILHGAVPLTQLPQKRVTQVREIRNVTANSERVFQNLYARENRFSRHKVYGDENLFDQCGLEPSKKLIKA